MQGKKQNKKKQLNENDIKLEGFTKFGEGVNKLYKFVDEYCLEIKKCTLAAEVAWVGVFEDS